MRKALRDKSRGRAPTSKATFVPSPTKGWYVGDNLSEAPAGTAYILDNAFPQLDYVRIRGGSTVFAAGMPSAPVTSLMVYNGTTSSKLFAFCSGSIYDCSLGGGVGAVLTGLNSTAYYEYIQYTGTGGSFLIAVNGVDP